jgi:hypothetical protein
VPEGVYSVEVEEQGYLKAVQADVRVVLRRAAAVEFALVRGSDTAGAGNLTSRGLDPHGVVSNSLLNREELRSAPGTGIDVLRALDGLPGLISDGEFASFSVRGRGPRDNLILIDDLPFDRVVHFDQTLRSSEPLMSTRS